ncbi:hypothetical protein HPP92_011465 [Vanilla planifolia]|uniref:Uncharacterized protein n=1 Tax=Vanilla planifolia TaxID=51239 RepID=A0A835V079_VANPL|nr:hypothetical protein HPP92_011465 [Vanilla planifolia]
MIEYKVRTTEQIRTLKSRAVDDIQKPDPKRCCNVHREACTSNKETKLRRGGRRSKAPRNMRSAPGLPLPIDRRRQEGAGAGDFSYDAQPTREATQTPVMARREMALDLKEAICLYDGFDPEEERGSTSTKRGEEDEAEDKRSEGTKGKLGYLYFLIAGEGQSMFKAGSCPRLCRGVLYHTTGKEYNKRLC